MGAGLKVEIFDAGVRGLNLEGGAVHDGMNRAGRKIRDLAVQEITRLGAVDSGKMRQAVAWEVRGLGVRGVSVRVGVDIGRTPGSTDYAYIVHQGRKGFGPRRARVLRFRPKGSRTFIFRPRVGPAAPKPFLTNALDRFRTDMIG